MYKYSFTILFHRNDYGQRTFRDTTPSKFISERVSVQCYYYPLLQYSSRFNLCYLRFQYLNYNDIKFCIIIIIILKLFIYHQTLPTLRLSHHHYVNHLVVHMFQHYQLKVLQYHYQLSDHL